MRTVKVTCHNCKKEFDKPISEYNRNTKKGMRHFCSKHCSVIIRNKELTPEQRKDHYYDISKHSGNRKNMLSPFSAFITRTNTAWRKSRYGNPNIDAKYLKELWESQKGICPYTNIKMILPNTSKQYPTIHSMKKASLDRIDSSKGYIKGNVEFVCSGINLAKNSFSKEEMQEFIKEIREGALRPPKLVDLPTSKPGL